MWVKGVWVIDAGHRSGPRECGLQVVCLFNRLRDFPERGSSNPELGSIMSIIACELE